MTLDSRVRIVEPTPVKPVFDEMRRLLCAQEAAFKQGISWDGINPAYTNDVGQGYAAWLIVKYGGDGPLVEWYEPSEGEEHEPDPAASIEISFDTPYGYRAENGAGCGDLHAWLIREIGRWCDARGLTWVWYDEFRGEWHPSTDPVTILGDPDKGRLRESVTT